MKILIIYSVLYDSYRLLIYYDHIRFFYKFLHDGIADIRR